MIEFGEFLPDLPAFENPGATEAKNVYPALKSYRPIGSLQDVSSNALDGPCLGAAAFKTQAGDVVTVAGDSSKLYVMRGDTWTGGGAYSVGDGQRWRFEQFGNYIIATYGGKPQKYDVAGLAQWEELGGQPPRMKYLAVVRDFLVGGVIDDHGDRVQWSAMNDPESWEVGTGQADFQIMPSGGPITGIFGGEYGLVFQESKITRMSYAGAPLIFQFDAIEENHGLWQPNSAVQYGKAIFYLSQNGFYMCDGTMAQPIGNEKVDRYFFNDADHDLLFAMTAAVDPVNKLVVWAYAGSGHTGKPNKLLIYNWALGRWSRAEVGVDFLMTALSPGYTLEDLDEFGGLDTLPYSLDSQFWKGGRLLMGAFDSSNKLRSFSGPNLEAVIETTEGEPAQGTRTRVRWTRPQVDSSAAKVQVGHRARLGDAVTWGTEAAIDARGRAPTRVYDRYMRARVTIPAGSSWTHAQGVDFIAFGGGGR